MAWDVWSSTWEVPIIYMAKPLEASLILKIAELWEVPIMYMQNVAKSRSFTWETPYYKRSTKNVWSILTKTKVTCRNLKQKTGVLIVHFTSFEKM